MRLHNVREGTFFSADNWRGSAANDQNLDKYTPLLNYLRALGQEKNASPVQIALAWILHQKPYIVPIPGMKGRERLVENSASISPELLREDSYLAVRQSSAKYPKVF